ncbi:MULTISPECIES: ATP-binding cassette domain-containing protein [Sporosarcina]|uniref:ATP-binding cassette domain-containing protein n=1 Tax=Sporosarcina TaxID=1569 RepID=UPI00129A105D|nr:MULTISPECIES: ABC transporter ATP-binding protein [Sporosarcina]GKV63991.1 ABC transporter [Sporosarcina sp. NCCP-2331]GLB54772.1 ABC transporter [Sporosarcina sp. NCCP-2378]
MPAISMKNVTKKYRSLTILDQVSLNIRQNVITGVVGRNGAGKTTLMKMIAGYTKETGGELRVFGERPFNSLSVSSNMIFIDDMMNFPDALTLGDILIECERFYANWDGELAKRLLEYFYLPLTLKHRILSKGKRSTFNAVVGIAARCPLTMFDEPITGMDSAARRDFYRALLKDYIAHPRTILLSSHHVEEMEDLLEDVLLIDGKGVGFHGPIIELQEKFLSLQGKLDMLEAHANRHAVIHRSTAGPLTEWIVDNEHTESEIDELKQAGIRVTPVSASNAYLAMTGQTRGGVDDVFNAMERA